MVAPSASAVTTAGATKSISPSGSIGSGCAAWAASRMSDGLPFGISATVSIPTSTITERRDEHDVERIGEGPAHQVLRLGWKARRRLW